MCGLRAYRVIMLTACSPSSSTSIEGFLRVGFEVHDVVKLSSLAKSMIHISSLQLEYAGRRLARLDDIIGAENSGRRSTGPAGFQRLPMSFRAARAFASIRPSRLGATFRMKLQYALLKGTRLSFTSVAGFF